LIVEPWKFGMRRVITTCVIAELNANFIRLPGCVWVVLHEPQLDSVPADVELADCNCSSIKFDIRPGVMAFAPPKAYFPDPWQTHILSGCFCPIYYRTAACYVKIDIVKKRGEKR
jgi:hypothetical protein